MSNPSENNFDRDSQEFPPTAPGQHKDVPENDSDLPPKNHGFRKIGPYKLLQQIGEGGMGTVWMAEQSQPIKRRVAIKLIKDVVDNQVLARFEVERQALAMMDHPNIAKILDAGTTKTGHPYFAMELIQGIPINEYCDRNRLTTHERLKLFVPVCRAVQHAHQKGIIHRDLKPSNILVQIYNGEPVAKIIDFGLAKALQYHVKLTEKTLFTKFGQVVGTVQYMSPEQATMDALSVDTKSDIYSLGVILYELLAGSTPVEKETLKNNAFLRVLEVIRETEPPKPSLRVSTSGNRVKLISELRREQPSRLQHLLQGELDCIVMKALEKDRNRRYETANDFADDINSHLTGDIVKARPTSTLYRLQKFSAKNKTLATFVIVLGISLLAGISGTLYGLEKANQKAVLAKAAEEQATKDKDRAEKSEARLIKNQRQLRKVNADATLQLAKARWDGNRVAEANELLFQIPDEYRDNFEWNYCSRYFLGSDITFFGHCSGVTAIDFSPTENTVVSAGWDGTIKVWNANNGAENWSRKIPTTGWWARRVWYSRDGKRIVSWQIDDSISVWDVQTGALLQSFLTEPSSAAAINADGTKVAVAIDDSQAKIFGIHIFDVNTGRRTTTLVGHSDTVLSIAFSRDGLTIASGDADSTVKLWNTKTGAELLSIQRAHAGAVTSIAIGPDGSKIACGSKQNTTIKLWDVNSGREINTLADHKGFILDVAFSPDGTRIASAGDDNLVKIWEANDGSVIFNLKGHIAGVTSVAFSADGSRIASGSLDNTAKVWDARSGANTVTVGDFASQISSLAISPDGATIALGNENNSIQLWDVPRAAKISKLHGHSASIQGVAFSSDGSKVASASEDKTIKIWDTSEGKELRTLVGHSRSVLGVAFSHDGSRIASTGGCETIKVWDVDTGKEIYHLDGRVYCVAFSPNGKYLASGSHDETVHIWNSENGKEITTLEFESRGSPGPMRCVAFSPNSRFIAAGSGDNIAIWDIVSSSQVMVFRSHQGNVSSLSFNSDGSRLVSGGDYNSIKVWNAYTGIELLMLKGHSDRVVDCCFTPDGNWVVSGGKGGTANVWNAQPHTEILRLSGHSAVVGCVVASPDGKRIASGSLDKTAKIWDVRTGSIVTSLEGHEGDVRSVAFSPNGRQIATADHENCLRLWDSLTGAAISNVEAEVGEVHNLEFGIDGKQIFSIDGYEDWVWNLKDRQLEKTDWIEINPKRTTYREGEIVSSVGNNVVLVDLNFKNLPNEKAYREIKSRFDEGWHRERALSAIANQDWFAACFHYAWILSEAGSAEPSQLIEFQKAFKELQLEFAGREQELKELLPIIVSEMLQTHGAVSE